MRRPVSLLVAVLVALSAATGVSARGARLLAVFSHPDDELFAAGTLARAALAGLDVQVVYTTSGGRGADKARRGLMGRLYRKVARPANLPRVREGEARRALRALGLERPPLFLRVRDSHVTARMFLVADRIERLLRELRPELVLTMGPQGVTGHRDHVATSAAVSVAFQRLGPVARLLHVVFTAERAARFRGFWAIKPVAREVVDHRVPVTAQATPRLEALSVYRTQFRIAELRRFERQVLPVDSTEELAEVGGRGPPPPLPWALEPDGDAPRRGSLGEP